jgi:hypothetical protein
MPAELPCDVQHALWKRDGYRCRDCGAAVNAERRPQAHRIVPHAQGGTDDPGNLITLCFACYATKGLRTYADILRSAAPDRLPEFVKLMTADFGRNLLAYSEWIDPVRFNPGKAIEEFELWRLYLDTIAGLAAAAGGSNQPAGDRLSDVESG